jgi:hypothetical protein
MKIDRFNPPANANDFDAAHHAAWSQYISVTFDDGIRGVEQSIGKGNSQFYNPTDPPPGAREDEDKERVVPIRWRAFPVALQAKYLDRPDLYFPEAEALQRRLLGIDHEGQPVFIEHRNQDEYCEWHTTRNEAGEIIRVQFTAEGPEYWSALAQGYPSPAYFGSDVLRTAPAFGDKRLLLNLYRRLVGERVPSGQQIELDELLFPSTVYEIDQSTMGYKLNDRGERTILFRQGDYNPWNKWNTRYGVVHLNHPSNTLGAEIVLGAESSVRRAPRGKEFEGEGAEKRLICCARYGVANRDSDPTIGFGVNQEARSDSYLTLEDPVGLYIDDLIPAAFSIKNNSIPPGDIKRTCWKVIRGQDAEQPERRRILRAVFEAPPDAGFTMRDILVNGEEIAYGGQIAEHIRIKLNAVIGAPGKKRNAPLRECEGKCCASKTVPDYMLQLPVNVVCPGWFEDAFPEDQPPIEGVATQVMEPALGMTTRMLRTRQAT